MRKKELKSLQKETDDIIIDANSVRIKFFRDKFRDKIENTSVAKFFLLDMMEEE